MKSTNCSQDCNQGVCPFVQDPHDENRYVCLKCGLERSLERFSFGDFLVMFVTTFFIVLMLI